CGLERLPEARPAGAAVIFGIGGEQRQITAGAGESPPTLLVIERARAGDLGAMQAQHVVLRLGEEAPPFAVILHDLERVPRAGMVAFHEPAQSGCERDRAHTAKQGSPVQHRSHDQVLSAPILLRTSKGPVTSAQPNTLHVPAMAGSRLPFVPAQAGTQGYTF